jgi:hypothetical protein
MPVSDSDSRIPSAVEHVEMPRREPTGSPRDPVLTLYIKKLIRDWEASGKDAKDLAKAAGVAPSLISGLKSDSFGVGGKSGVRFAKAFGRDYPDFIADAYGWWKVEGKAAHPRVEPDPVPERELAIAIAKRLGVHPRAIQDAREASFPPNVTPSAKWLVKRMLAYDELFPRDDDDADDGTGSST